MAELKSQIYELKKNQMDADSIYGFLGAFKKCIQNIKFQFPVPIIKEGKEVAQIKGISLDKEKSNEHMISLEKLSTLETVVLLSKLK